jgi:murein DD-endopeptidase MepM/ murein hydrolase activator NlpD
VLLTSVQSNTQARNIMTKGGSLEIYHILEEGETIADVAAKFGVDVLNIYDENNDNVITEAEQGDKICIRTEVDPVSVKMVEEGRMREVIPYETVKEDSDEYYKGDTYTKQEGIDRVQIFDGTITKVGGEITKRKKNKIDILVEGQDKIILIGTAERPKTAPTGTYAMPIDNYTISSNFGARWGRLHSGMDLAAPTGTPIYATDGGTVVRAGWYAGYGLCVDIDHENGRMTRYGHCSKLLVNAGDKVFQRQNIALVGNTGHSFGSHLHFEIRFNDSPTDPRPYLDLH